MRISRWLAALLLALTAPLISAQWAPTKPVRIIVAFPPGGIVDLMARTVSDRLSATRKYQQPKQNGQAAQDLGRQ